MADDKILKPKSFRIDDETAEKFKNIASIIGGNQQETLSKLIETFEFQQGKIILTNKKDDIETFENYVTSLTRMYMSALEENQNVKGLVRVEFEALLKSKDVVIQELQQKLELEKQLQQQATNKTMILTDENESLNNKINVLQTKYNTDIKNLKSMIDDKDKLNNVLNSSYTQLKVKVELLQNELGKFTEIKNELEELRLKSNNFESEKNNLLDEYKTLAQQNKFEMQKVILNLEKKYYKEIQDLTKEKQSEIDNYKNKYFSLLERQNIKKDK